VITYEYPMNERVRTLLRLEDLFDKLHFFVSKSDSEEHHSALLTLFELLDVAGRADLKSDLLQELERQRQVLEALRGRPEVAMDTLEHVLTDIDRISKQILGLNTKAGQHLRDNEWLMGVRQRSSIPGGVCEFDLPSYHYWLHLPADTRRHDLETWAAPFKPIHDGLVVVLKLLRESGRPNPLVAYAGTYQQMPAGKLAQMLRVTLSRDIACVPEVSANKYALNIRFLTMDWGQRPKLYEHDVEFDLTFCNL
jgi:cell division protein ZapD